MPRSKRKEVSSPAKESPKTKKSKGLTFANCVCVITFFVLLNCTSSVCSPSAVDPLSFKAVHSSESTSASGSSSSSSSAQCASNSPCGAKVQKPAPSFSADAVVNGQFKSVSLDDYKGKYLVVFFYPMDFTFVCPTEIIAFSDRSDEFRSIDCEVLAISVDSKFTHLAWVNTPRKEGGLGPMKIPLVSDITKQISRDYGVLLEEGEDAGVSLRGLFIINEKGIVRHISINDLPVGRSIDETLRLVQAFQYTDKYGEVCPSGWKPGDLTMHPDPTKSKEYFSKVFSH